MDVLMWVGIATVVLLFGATLAGIAYRLGYWSGKVDGKLEKLEATAVQLLNRDAQK